MDYNDTLEQLNIELGDTNNVTFTVEEKQRALTKAWNDSDVVNTVWNSTLTFDQSTYQYAIPATLDTIKDIYISASNSTADAPEKIDSDLWEVVNGNIQFSPKANSAIAQGYTLYLKGNYKLDPDTDTISNVTLQEYVIALAGWETLRLLGYKKANLFLKNDITMTELITLKRDFENDVKNLRNKLHTEFESA